tara:strand:+ start:639 stop:854 length:216 start_codon:yes stop_codon:yes gene_type:complete
MSTEKIISNDEKDLAELINLKKSEKKFLGRVDINDLLARARRKETKENKINLVFFFLFVSLVFVVGIILSF